jgi:hypothetical protein
LIVPYETHREGADGAPAARDPLSKPAHPVLRLGGVTLRLLDGSHEPAPDLHVDEVRVLAPLTSVRVSTASSNASDMLHAPDVCIVPPGQRLHVRGDPGSEAVFVALDTVACEERVVRAHGRPSRIIGTSAGPDAALRDTLEAMIPELRTGRSTDAADARLHQLALHLSNTYGVPESATSCAGLTQPRLERVLSMIDENLTHALPVAELAEAVNLSPFHFSRMFRVSAGRSPCSSAWRGRSTCSPPRR